MRDTRNITFATLNNEDTLPQVLTHLHKSAHRFYSGGEYIERTRSNIDQVLERLNLRQQHAVINAWNNTLRFFQTGANRISPSQIVRSALTPTNAPRPIIVVDLSRRPDGIKQSIWDDKIKPILINRFLHELEDAAETAYQNEKSLNTLVVIDEAHRLAPQESGSGTIRTNLIDAVRTTRKYGLGWLFISQTLASLDTEIIQQLRIFFLGFGLSMGTESQRLRELVSDKASLSLYQRFRDPHSSFDAESKEYSFMTIGPVSPLSFSGTPLFFNAFNDVREFTGVNRFSVQARLLD